MSPLNLPFVQGLLTVCEVHILPIANPDGVAVGNSKTNLGGQDLPRCWTKESILAPEANHIKRYFKFFSAGKVVMHLDIHANGKQEKVRILHHESRVEGGITFQATLKQMEQNLSTTMLSALLSPHSNFF